MVKNQSIYVLDDQYVVVFSVQMEGCNAKVECLFKHEEILDYTIEYNGPVQKREEVLEYALYEAKVLIKKAFVYG
ncbi:hypothetical protein [Bacillus sp. FJAT-47783]|uniref:hypothetical protein n=1 Tax=Bacillus sp. FJAT-47783 TaxID=2922712 RepID=UPI001FACBEEB|nr:hypothetical protein [Bacillus sp. FJAT-47783]